MRETKILLEHLLQVYECTVKDVLDNPNLSKCFVEELFEATGLSEEEED